MSNDNTDDGATPEPDPVHNPRTNTTADHDDAPDKDAELARWKAQSRENEKRAKANADAAKELEKLKAANMSEVERVVAETKAATRAEVLREVGATRVGDVVRLAAAGRTVDVEAILEGLDKSVFLDDDGQPDAQAIRAWIDRIAPAPTTDTRTPRVPAGVREPGTPKGDAFSDFARIVNSQLTKS